MEIPPEVIAAKNALEDSLLQTGLITGIDFGVRNEEQPDSEDLVLRIFVRDASNVPIEVHTAIEFFPFPFVIIHRVFSVTQLPDNQRYRPVLGGVSVANSSRFLASGSLHAGTLGAIVTDAFDPTIRYGLSNYHVLCVDDQRQVGDEIVQPVPTLLGVLLGDKVGTLHGWSFPETTQEGVVDTAICILDLEIDSVPKVAEIGPISGIIAASLGMFVTKRGRTTGQSFGWISGIDGSYPLDFPQLPPVTTPTGLTTNIRIFKNQIQIHADFPHFIVFGDHGDSGSVVLGTGNQVVGLYWGSGSDTPGDPLTYGLANHASAVERKLGITF